jgi:hypothetical protein
MRTRRRQPLCSALRALGAFFVILNFTGAMPVLADPGISSSAVFQIDYLHPAMIPSHWILTIHSDGSGHFRSERSKQAIEKSSASQTSNVDRDINLHTAFVQQVFATVRKRNLLNYECDSSSKVAFQGWKELSYSGPDGKGSCKFNYSSDRDIQSLGDSLQGVAETILEGARLGMLLQYDRLGLDKELENYQEAVNSKRARELYLIRDILERLANDTSLMQRVRKRATALLAATERGM